MSWRKGAGQGGKPSASLSTHSKVHNKHSMHHHHHHMSQCKRTLGIVSCFWVLNFILLAWHGNLLHGCWIITESYLPLFFFFTSDGLALSSQADCWHLGWPTLWCPQGRAVHPCTWYLLPANQHPRNQLQQRASGTVSSLHAWKHQRKVELNWAL